MKRDGALELPEGLPARFMDSEKGFAMLCEFLNIGTRGIQQQIINTDGVKRAIHSRKASARNLSTSKRLQAQITTFYSLPNERRKLWQHILNTIPDMSCDFPFDVPSIEYKALECYDPAILRHEPDEARISEFLSDFPNVAVAVSDYRGWQRPALAAWSNLRDDLLQWASLSSSRQDAVTLATFAVATLLDDVRILEWAADRTTLLAREYEFALHSRTHDVDTAQDQENEKSQDAKKKSARIINNWNAACATAGDIISTLGGEHPRPEHLDDLIKQVNVLEQLRTPLITVLNMRRSKKLVERVVEIILTLAGSDTFSWLADCKERIFAQWMLYYAASRDADGDILQQDVERVKRELESAASELKMSERTYQGYRQQLQELETNPHKPGDLLTIDNRNVQIQDLLAGAARKRRDTRRRFFQIIAPSNQEFDPSKDYEREYEHSTEFRTYHEAEGSVQDPATHRDRNRVRQVAEAIEPTAAEDNRRVTTSPDTLTAGENEGVEEALLEPRELVTDSPAADATSPVASPDKTGRVDDVHLVEPSDNNSLQDTSTVATLWRSIDAGRLGIAYHIAKLLEEQDYEKNDIPPANLIAASALAAYVQSADGELVTALRPLLESIDLDSLSYSDEGNRDAVNLLLFCAALRPALFAPSTGAASILRRISAPEFLTPVYTLATTIANHADRLQGVRLDATRIRSALLGGWEDEFATFVARVGDWRKRAESQRIIFHRANRVWRDLFAENGCLAELIELISADDPLNNDKIEAVCKQIGEQKSFNDLVQKTDRRGRKGNPIEGRALKQLWDHVQPAIELSNEWIGLMNAKPDPKGFVAGRIEALSRDISLYGNEAIAAIDSAAATENSMALVAALKQSRNCVETLLEIFDDVVEPTRVFKASSDVVRSRDLLYVTELDLDSAYRPTNHDGSPRLLELLLNISAHADSLSDAFNARLARGDTAGAQLACESMDAEADPEADRCRTALDQKIEGQRCRLKKEHSVVEGRLERAFCLGHIDNNDRADLAARLVSLERLAQPDMYGDSPPNVVDAIANAKSELVRIQQSIEESKALRTKDAKGRLDLLVAEDPESENRSVISQTIESGDILAANELISRIEKRESIDLPIMADNPFFEFMSVVEDIDRTIGEPKNLQARSIIQRVAARECLGGMNFQDLSEEEAAHAANLLTTWYTISKAQHIKELVLESLLHQLGFSVLNISTVPGRGREQIDLVTEVIEDRDICPSRQFGSEARGHYRILLNWKRPPSDLIAESLGVTGGAPTIMLHFGCLGAERENIRKLAVQTHRLFLVIDDSIVLFLASRRSGRLSALFRSTLPFSSVDPYATTSSLVPPELFYGRERERREITDQSGSCFIYGGRQLGKTALLRRVERDFNRPRSANVAKWIDLKVNEIGYARGPREIWPLLQRELQVLGIVPARRRELDPEDRRQVNTLLNKIQQWIDQPGNRRLLLLLDEADAFLEQDARLEFRESAKLKGLMDMTERRFKIVFAGLHNVLRTTRQANHPLAHFGEPIQVGAMLLNGEWRQAHALVREPLQTVGFLFEGDELSTRILAQTNYYPSLIQLYGAELVRRLRDSVKTFPYMIGDEEINAAYSSQELRSAIRERFLLTLQLDQRYEVIAYALTQEINGEADLGKGLSLDEIADAAKAWWPEGFTITDIEFSMLLHEMAGLGVLRSIEQGRRYTLRNPNILLLLGNSDDIEKTLGKERQAPLVYEPASFRARYPKRHPSHKKRGPLTYWQESELRAEGGVTVISGCNAAGLEHVAEFLQQRIEPDLFHTLHSVSDLGKFEQELKDLRPIRNMVTVCLVPFAANWDVSWVRTARQVLDRRAIGRRISSRVVFTSTPESLWRMTVEESQAEKVHIEGADWIEIGPWDKRFLRHWLEDINFTADANHVEQLMDVSGGWPAVLDRFGDESPRRSWDSRIEKLKRELIRDRAMQDFGIHSEEVERILRTLLSEQVFDRDSIEVASQEIGIDSVEITRRVKWSERLGLVSDTGERSWKFNPLVRRLLESSDTA